VSTASLPSAPRKASKTAAGTCIVVDLLSKGTRTMTMKRPPGPRGGSSRRRITGLVQRAMDQLVHRLSGVELLRRDLATANGGRPIEADEPGVRRIERRRIRRLLSSAAGLPVSVNQTELLTCMQMAFAVCAVHFCR